MRPDEYAARAREQQRQHDNAIAAQRARQQQAERDSARAAQDASARRVKENLLIQGDRQRESMRAADKQHQTDEDARNRRRRNDAFWRKQNAVSYEPSQPAARRQVAAPPVSSGKGKSSASGGFVLVVLVIGAIAYFNHQDVPSGGTAGGAPQTSPAFQPGNTLQNPPPKPSADIGRDGSVTPGSVVPGSEVSGSVLPGSEVPGQQISSPSQPASSNLTLRQQSLAPQAAPPRSGSGLTPLRKIAPVYPELAASAGVHGQVLVSVQVAPDGSVISAGARNGDPRLINAAVDAARQWQYQPYTPLGGRASVEDLINFSF